MKGNIMSDSMKPKGSWNDCMKVIEHKWHVPIVFVEWVCWQISPFLRQLSFLEVLKYLSRLAVIVAVIFYIWGCEDRQKAKHYQAWQVINLAQGKTGSGGRKDALQDLHKDKVSLAGVDISKAHLLELKLENADLREANLAEARLPNANLCRAKLLSANITGTVLNGANLDRAELTYANLSGAELTDANFSGAVLYDANLADADLVDTNLSGASLVSANLTKTRLLRTNLTKAILIEANLAEANFSGVNLMDAKLVEANLTNVKEWQNIKSIKNANIFGVMNPPDGFIKWAIEHGAVSIEDKEEWKKLVSEKKSGKNEGEIN
jgi:hypothetical protein